jgi:hypothetical protein
MRRDPSLRASPANRAAIGSGLEGELSAADAGRAGGCAAGDGAGEASRSPPAGLGGRATLYEPAPQSVTAETAPGVERLFARAHRGPFIDSGEAEERLKREIAFDPDLWIVEVEDGVEGVWLDLAP